MPQPNTTRKVYRRLEDGSFEECLFIDLAKGQVFFLLEPDGTLVEGYTYRATATPKLNQSGILGLRCDKHEPLSLPTLNKILNQIKETTLDTSDIELLKDIGFDPSLSTSAENKTAKEWVTLARKCNSNARDCIFAAFKNGPLFDGSVPSKAGRNWCLKNELMTKVIVKGEWGFNALTYKGAWVHKLLTVLESSNVHTQE